MSLPIAGAVPGRIIAGYADGRGRDAVRGRRTRRDDGAGIGNVFGGVPVFHAAVVVKPVGQPRDVFRNFDLVPLRRRGREQRREGGGGRNRCGNGSRRRGGRVHQPSVPNGIGGRRRRSGGDFLEGELDRSPSLDDRSAVEGGAVGQVGGLGGHAQRIRIEAGGQRGGDGAQFVGLLGLVTEGRIGWPFESVQSHRCGSGNRRRWGRHGRCGCGRFRHDPGFGRSGVVEGTVPRAPIR